MQVRKPWLATKKGIALTRKCFIGASLGALCYEVFPHTVLLPLKRAGQEESMKSRLRLDFLPYQVQEYVRRVIDDMKFTDDHRKALSVYLTDLSDVETFGNINSIFGTLVKLPYMLWNHYPISEDVRGIKDGEHPEATKRFHESLQWSDNAKLYFTAYQVAWTSRYQFLAQGAFNAVGVMSAYTACYLLTSSKHRLIDRPGAAVLLNFIVVGLFGVSWMFATDLTNCENEEAIMREVCSLGPTYAEGAVELYKKMQQHNLAIREMVGAAGIVRYTENGDTRSPFRRATVPLSDRLVIVETIAESYRNGSQTLDDKEDKNKPSTDVKKQENKPLTDVKKEENKPPTSDKKEENKRSTDENSNKKQ